MASPEGVPHRSGVVDRLGFLCVLAMPVVALTNLFSLTKFVDLNVRPTDVLFTAAWIFWGWKVAWTMRLHRSLTTLLFMLGGLMFVTLLGILLFDNAVGWPRYLRFTQTLSWAALAFTFLETERRVEKYASAVVLVSVIIGAVSIGLYLIDPTLHRIAGYFSFAGGEGLEGQASFNEWGALYALSLTVLLWRLYRGTLSKVHLVSGGIILGGLLLVQSRSAFLAVAAVVIILLGLYAKRLYREGLPGRSAMVLLGLAATMALIAIASEGLTLNRLSESLVPGSGAYFSMQSRFDVWQLSMDLWNAGVLRFLLGYGGESFASRIDSPTADSFYLDHGLSQGLLGLVFVLAILIMPALKLKHDPLATFGILIVAVALTVSLTGNVLADPTYGGVTFSLLYGLLAIHHRRPRCPAPA